VDALSDAMAEMAGAFGVVPQAVALALRNRLIKL
jgi:hypothetical protein